MTSHNDVAAVERVLARRDQRRALVLAETIYSVLGDAGPVAELAAAVAAYDAVLIADEAHALGVAGPGGRGLLTAHGLAGRPDVIATGTLSKSFGAQGGLVLGVPAVREHLINRARPFIYDTGLAPAAAGGALTALQILTVEPELSGQVRANAAVLADAAGVDAPAGAVLSVPMPGPREALAGVATAAGHGLRIGCFRPPSTPDGISRLRLTAHAHHTGEELALAAKVLRRVVPGRPVTICFVTGTDTEVGKTAVTAALAAAARAFGQSVAVVKPVQTGLRPGQPGDLDEVRRLAGPVDVREGARLPDPLAPDRAALLAGVELPSLDAQRDLILDAAKNHDAVLVEGAGGVTVRLGHGFTLLDIAREVGQAAPHARWIIVARPGLGTLNHATLTAWAIRTAGSPCTASSSAPGRPARGWSNGTTARTSPATPASPSSAPSPTARPPSRHHGSRPKPPARSRPLFDGAMSWPAMSSAWAACCSWQRRPVP